MDLGPLESMGFIRVFKQTFQMIYSSKKIFTQITLAFIFPMTLLMICQMHVLDSLFNKMDSNRKIIFFTPSPDIATLNALLDCLAYQDIVLLLVNVLYLFCFSILWLLSTSAVTYTVGCIYTGADLKFPKVVRAVQSTWKKFLIKNAWNMLLHHFIALYVLNSYLMQAWLFTLTLQQRIAQSCIAAALTASIFSSLEVFKWHLVGVISTFENMSVTQTEDDFFTPAAMKFIVVMLHLLTLAAEASYYLVVVHGHFFSHVHQPVSGIICSLLLSAVILFGLVVQTIAYFLWKASNHESIEKSCISNILRVYLAERVPQKKCIPLKVTFAV